MATSSVQLPHAEELFSRGAWEQAEDVCLQLLRLNPENADALLLLGGIHQKLGRIDDWISTLERLLALRPQRPEVLSNLGSALALRGDLQAAERHFREAVRLGPQLAEIHKNLGNVLRRLGRDEEAKASYTRAVELRPHYVQALNCLAELLAQSGDFSQSLDVLYRALELQPDFLEAQINLGTTLALMCRNEEALAAYEQALRLNPDSAEAHLNKSFVLLRRGDFWEGWQEYEWRLKCKGISTPQFRRPRWTGQALNRKRVLLCAEQGHGDTIQFIRYAGTLKALGATVLVRCPKRLLRLLSRCEDVDQWCLDTNEPPPFDCYAPLASAPYLLRASHERIPNDVPYIFPDPGLALQWRQRLQDVVGLKIGVAWQGNPRYQGDRLRSIPLRFFEPLASHPDTRLISLQIGFGSEQVSQVADRFAVLEFGPDFDERNGPFMDAAAVISNLDLVITSDTAVAHLAGAMGARVWLALPRVANWRWMQDREDSPWYPTMRLFRQERAGDWEGVFRRMSEELPAFRSAATSQVPARPPYRDAERYNLAGVHFAQEGKLSEAIASFRQALQINPELADAHNNLAIALARRRNFDEAAAAFRRALHFDPASSRTHNNLGSVLAEQQDFETAIRAYRQALQLDPHYLDAYCNLGKAQRKLGRLEEAAQSFRHALAINPKLAGAQRELGIVLAALERRDDAICAFQKAIEFDPEHAESHYHLGCLLKDAGRCEDAIECFESALGIQSDHAEARNCLGICLAQLGEHEKAIEHYLDAIRIRPGFSAAYSNWGIALSAQGRLHEALDKYRIAQEFNASSPEVYNNMGSALCGLGRCDEGLQSYERALELKPDYAEAHRNRSVVRLLRGDFAAGWPEYEWRWKCRDFQARTFEQPRWNGESLDGKTILLHAEQGLGDTLQFVRYAAALKQLGATVIVHAPKQLARILARCPGVDRLITDADQRPAFDVHLPLMSVPHVVQTTAETIPQNVPYLFADEQLASEWGEQLEGVTDLRVGISWQGNRKYAADKQRSIPLSEFEILGAIPGVWLLSLQKGPASEQLHDLAAERSWAEVGPDLDSAAGPFMDTAAIMQHLDLVITSDTAIAHLAGGLGVPVWAAIPFAPDWRWQLEGDRCPWYPTMRLFRQTEPGDWKPVFQRIAAALQERVGQRPQRPAAPQSGEKALALNQQGVRLAESGRLADALDCFRRATWLDSKLISARYNYGTTLHRLGRYAAAIASFRLCTQLAPAYAEAHAHLGVSLASAGQIEQAEASLRTALRHNPRLIGALSSLGNVLTAQGRFNDALACFNRWLEIDPAFAEGEFGIGNALLEMGRHGEALQAFDRAIRAKPCYVEAIKQRARTLLLIGDLPRGWDDYHLGQASIELQTESPRWRGEPLSGKRILLLAGADEAESLLFARYIACLKQRGAFVILRAPGRQKDLWACIDGADQTIADSDPIPSIDCWASLADLPGAFQTTWDTIPVRVPYVNLPEDHNKRWHARLRGKGGFRIGVCGASQASVLQRGISLARLARLAEIPGVQLIRLPDAAEQADSSAEPTGVPWIELTPGGKALSLCEAAAAMTQLDLVLGVDCTLAHVAGALGIPVWVVLPYAPRWYWRLDREDCAWYPSARLFRQSEIGRWDDVYDALVRALRQALSQEPVQVDGAATAESDAWNRKGIAFAEGGDLDAAMDCFREAAKCAASSAEAYNNLGSALARLGRLEEAAANYLTAIQRAPTHAEAHSNLGVVFSNSGRYDDAARHFRQAIKFSPNLPNAHCRLGNARLSQGDLDEAIACYERAIALDPDDWDARFGLAVALREASRLDEAITAFERLEKIRPDDPEVHNNLGIAHSRLGNYHAAIECLKRAIERRPDHAPAYNNLGIALDALERYDEALAAYGRALEIEPRYAEAHSNLGTVLAKLQDFAGSLEEFEKALELKPGYAEAYNNRGVTYKEMRRLGEALANYDEAIRLKPDYVDARMNRALTCLLTGDFQAGWTEFEWRWKAPGKARVLPRPEWDGRPLDGKAILLHCEQGLGDTLQFIRYANLVKRQGAKVIVRCPKALAAILGLCDDLDVIVAEGDPLPPFDCHAPLMSLARIFNTTLDTIPANVPYLRADRKLIERWAADLASGAGLSIGIGWQGNPRYQADRQRSIPLAAFAPVAELPGIQLFSLQKGTGVDQIAQLRGKLHVEEFGPERDESSGPFMDTAAIMALVDLVITSDTAIAHLAGGLGVKVWTALPYTADWRWLTGRSDSPWYPSMRLFRQAKPGDWRSVFDEMRNELEKELEGRASANRVGQRDA